MLKHFKADTQNIHEANFCKNMVSMKETITLICMKILPLIQGRKISSFERAQKICLHTGFEQLNANKRQNGYIYKMIQLKLSNMQNRFALMSVVRLQ